MPTEKTLIHYCALHCTHHVQRGASDALYTLVVYRKGPAPGLANPVPEYELWAYWGGRGREQKATYKASGREAGTAIALDHLIAGQEAKGYVIVAGGKVGKNTEYWATARDLGVPHVISTGMLPSGIDLGHPFALPQPMGNTGSGAAPLNRAPGQNAPRAMSPNDVGDGPIARAMREGSKAGSLAEAMATPIRGTSKKERDEQNRRLAEVELLRARIEELERLAVAAGGPTSADEAAARITRRIVLED